MSQTNEPTNAEIDPRDKFVLEVTLKNFITDLAKGLRSGEGNLKTMSKEVRAEIMKVDPEAIKIAEDRESIG